MKINHLGHTPTRIATLSTMMFAAIFLSLFSLDLMLVDVVPSISSDRKQVDTGHVFDFGLAACRTWDAGRLKRKEENIVLFLPSFISYSSCVAVPVFVVEKQRVEMASPL